MQLYLCQDIDVCLKRSQRISSEDSMSGQLHPQRVVQRRLQVRHVHPWPVCTIMCQQRTTGRKMFLFIPVEGSPGLLCSIGEDVCGDWRFPCPHHPWQPLEDVRVKRTSLDFAGGEKERWNGPLGHSNMVISSFQVLVCTCIYDVFLSTHMITRCICKLPGSNSVWNL